ncbi:MAG: hypothetical protein JO218_19065, partial [Burkholderiales bacterium]|nr:hypothetical protein [Burkholderiales bacterium]
LVVMANHRISHDIDASWRCYSDDAKEGASNSLLGMGANGPEAVTNFMRDSGPDNAAVHHRRWLLYPQSKFIGLGDVPNADKARAASGFTAFDGLYGSNRPHVVHDYVAWPPPGWIPYEVAFPRWSFSLPGADFSAASVTVELAGAPVPVQIEPPNDTAGEPSIVWSIAQGVDHLPKPEHDTRYRVTIEGVKLGSDTRRFAYDVTVFDPDAPAPGKREALVVGPARISTNGAVFGVPPQPGATGSEWRALYLERWPIAQGAEHGYGAFSYAGSNDYPVIQAQVVASSKQAFRLAHTHLGDEVLLLSQPIVAGAQARLAFKSRRGVAGSDEVANVDVLVEGRDNWETVYTQRSDGTMASAEKEFSAHQVDLSPYAGRLLQLRFRYTFANGSYFTPDDARVGWYLDEIRLDGAYRVVSTGEPARSAGGKFEFKPDRSGEWRLQARPLVYRAAGDWGPLAAVTVE